MTRRLIAFSALLLVASQSVGCNTHYIREGLWKKAIAAKPDYVFIQFGHNDCPGKGDRSTDPKTDFRDNLRRYIRDARLAGAKPVLITPMTRRVFRVGRIHRQRFFVVARRIDFAAFGILLPREPVVAGPDPPLEARPATWPHGAGQRVFQVA